MDFLRLCQRTVEKCAISGSMVSVSGRSGEMLRVVNWVNEAWHDIQLAQAGWDWMRYEFTLTTIAGQQGYTPAEASLTSFSRWHTDTLRIYKTDLGLADDKFIVELDYKSFRDTYMLGVQLPGAPTVFAVKPRGSSLLFGAVPDGVYTVYGEYQKAPHYLVENTDTPDMPDEYHMAIVHAARMKYAAYENAPEVMMEASRDFDRLMGNLAMTQIEEVGLGGPLA